ALDRAVDVVGDLVPSALERGADALEELRPVGRENRNAIVDELPREAEREVRLAAARAAVQVEPGRARLPSGDGDQGVLVPGWASVVRERRVGVALIDSAELA